MISRLRWWHPESDGAETNAASMSSDDVQIDQWSGWDHKSGATGETLGLPTWVTDDEDLRRLRSYGVASAYNETVARYVLPVDAVKKTELREQGEAPAIVARHAAATVGDDLTIRVEGAAADLPDEPPVPDEPVLGEAESEHGRRVRKRVFDAQIRQWEREAGETIDSWEEDAELQPLLRRREQYLRAWSTAADWEATVREEQLEMVVPLGDGLSVFHVNPGEAPTKTLWEPDTYFPVFENGEIVDKPSKVHLAYEYLDEKGNTWVRRVTYELVGLFAENELGEEFETVRDLPYSDSPVSVTCVMTDAHFKRDGKSGELKTPTRFEEVIDPATNTLVPADEVDLLIDFIPISFKTRTMAKRTHFGRPLLVRVAQLLDEIQSADTDTARAAALNGSPPMVAADLLVKSKNGRISLGPGVVLGGGKDAALSPLDMSANLTAGVEYCETLRDRLSGATATPPGLLGRPVQMNNATGVGWQMSFTPFMQEVATARMVLHPLLVEELQIVQKLAIVAKDPALDGDHRVYPAFCEFGSFMPNDLPALVKLITELAAQDLMEPKLAFRLLEGAGMDVGDIEQVVEAIRLRDTARASDLADVMGRKYAARWMGVPWQDGDDPDAVDDVNPPAPVLDLSGAVT